MRHLTGIGVAERINHFIKFDSLLECFSIRPGTIAPDLIITKLGDAPQSGWSAEFQRCQTASTDIAPQATVSKMVTTKTLIDLGSNFCF